MKEFELANALLNDILLNDVTFKKALKTAFPKNSHDRVYLSKVSALVGCELRHHSLFLNLSHSLNENITNEEKNLIFLAMANIYFLKKHDNVEVIKYVKSVLGDKYDESVKKLLTHEGVIGDLVDIDKNSLKYFAIRFNTPEWLVKMWIKHFGRTLTLKTLKANNYPAKAEVRVDENKVNVSNDPNFEKSEVENVYYYKNKDAYRKLPGFTFGDIFPLKGVVKALIDEYADPFAQEFSIYSGNDDSLVKELNILSKGEKGINVVVPELSKRPELLRYVRTKKLKNINLFEANDEVGFQVGLSRKQDFLLLNPLSSSFDKIRKYPDYMLHFKKDDFDAFIKNQKMLIESLSKFVEEDGTFIYIVDTINKKESFGVVTSFLLAHPEFSLINERQIFPFEKEDTAIYFAVMKLNRQKND